MKQNRYFVPLLIGYWLHRKKRYRKGQSCFMEYEPCTSEPSSYCTFIKYVPHGKQHPKIVQRYRIRFISTGSSTLPISFVSMIIQIVRRCSSASGIFPLQRWCKPNAMKLASIAEVQPILSKVSASGILQGSALQCLISNKFSTKWGAVAPVPFSQATRVKIYLAIPCT